MKKGFTLIELLVVVLIIGILSAVALPQYQKAVHKSRIGDVFNGLRVIRQGMEGYYLANGTWPTSLDDLDISVPQGDWQYELVNATGAESALWPKLGQPRGWASIAAWNTKLGGGYGKGAIFYSLPSRPLGHKNGTPGVFCCLWSEQFSAQFGEFCRANKGQDSSVGFCYTGTKVPIRAE